jgi:predicted transcriptional regulator
MKSALDNMRFLGIPSNVAKVLAVLSDGKPHSLRDIETKGDMRQGDASIAVNALTPYLTVKTKDAATKGRPQKIVVMSRKSYVQYVEACVDCYKVAYEVAADAGKELLK